MESRCGRVRIRTVSGVSKVSEKVPGLTAANRLLPFDDGEGFAVDDFRGPLGLMREIVESEIAAVELGQAVDRGDKPIAHADLNFHGDAFPDIELMFGYFQVHEGGTIGRQANAIGAGSAWNGCQTRRRGIVGR